MILILAVATHTHYPLVFYSYFSIFAFLFFFFFNDTATTEIYTLSLHDALPILAIVEGVAGAKLQSASPFRDPKREEQDRKSTRLNSSHPSISYAVFCLKKKKKKKKNNITIKKTDNTESNMRYIIMNCNKR